MGLSPHTIGIRSCDRARDCSCERSCERAYERRDAAAARTVAVTGRRAVASAAVIAALALALALVPSLAHADAKDLPAGKIGMTAGLRQGVGALGNDFALGPLVGFEAGYHPRLLWFQNWSFGANWSILWGNFGADDASQVAGNLNIREMSFGLRIRRLLAGEEQEIPRFMVISTGLSLLRSNVPLPPDSAREYVGPYVGFGVEQYLERKYLLSFEARYGIIGSGPGSFSFMVGFAFGSK